MSKAWLSLALLCFAVLLSAQTTPTPELGLDVNAQSEAVVANGWPLLIRVAVVSTDGQAVRIRLNGGPWTQALHLAITDANGVVQNWPVQLLVPASSTLYLNGITSAEAVWLVAPTDTSTLVPGLYSLSVTLDTTAAAASGTWSGSVQGNIATVQLQAEPATLSAEVEASKYLAFAAYARLRGDKPGTQTALDTLINHQPDILEAYTEKADLLAAGGDFAGALALAEQALQKFFVRYPNPPEPPTILMLRVGDLADQRAVQQAAGGGRIVTCVEPGSTATVVTPESIVAAYGGQLATGTADNGGSLSTTLGGTTVTITDSSGRSSPALLFSVSPGQVNYAVPASVALGPATVVVKAGDGSTSTGLVSVAAIEPALFTFNADGLIAGNILRFPTGGGDPVFEQLFTLDSAGAVSARPVDLSTGQVFLVLYGTGIRGAAAGQVSVSIGGVATTVTYAGAQGTDVGLDQVNVLLPPSLAGRGDVPLVLTAAGKPSNTARITFK